MWARVSGAGASNNARTSVNLQPLLTARPSRLQPVADQYPALGAQSRLTVTGLDTTPELDDVTLEALVARNLHDHPFERDGLVRKDRAPEPYPELEPDHRALLREMRGGQAEEQGRRVSAAGDDASVPCGRRELGVVVNGI